MAHFAFSEAPGITYGFILVAAILILGLVVFDLPKSHVVFSRRAGIVTIRHGIRGRGEPQVIKLNTIRNCYAEIAGSNSMVTGSSLTGGQKRLRLALRDNTSVPLSQISTFNTSQDIAVKAVNDWLGRKPD